MRGATTTKSEIKPHTKKSEANEGEKMQKHTGGNLHWTRRGRKQGNEILDELIGIMQELPAKSGNR